MRENELDEIADELDKIAQEMKDEEIETSSVDPEQYKDILTDEERRFFIASMMFCQSLFKKSQRHIWDKIMMKVMKSDLWKNGG